MKSKIIIQHVDIVETEEDIGPPDFEVKLTFHSLQEWLLSICIAERPQKATAIISMGVFESTDERILFLIGINRYGNHNEIHNKIEFTPQSTYFLLPKEYYNGLTRDQLNEKLAKQLSDFTKTQEFQHSLLSESNCIQLNGKEIWTK
jgi:hypothetical protein